MNRGPAVAALLVLPLHSQKAADGEKPDGVFGLPLSPPQQLGAHAEGKLVHLYPKQLGKEEVPQFVEVDDDAEHQNGKQYRFQNKIKLLFSAVGRRDSLVLLMICLLYCGN